MIRWFKQVDSILRGDATRMESIRDGQVTIPVGGIIIATVLMCMVYGFCMGSFTAFSEDGAKVQLLASVVKFPLLFMLTLVITFPSLYVFNALVGSRLEMRSALRLLVASVAVMAAVSASLGPIVLFFAFCTTSYVFMVLLNVAACSVGGFLGLAFLLRTLHRLAQACEPEMEVVESAAVDTSSGSEGGGDDIGESSTVDGLDRYRHARGALDRFGPRTNRRAKIIFQVWLAIFALVGAQMSWLLRPFIGSPGTPFSWFREKDGNFFEAVFGALGSLLGM